MGRSFVRRGGRVGVAVAALVASSLFALPAASGADSVLGQTGSQPGLNCDGSVSDGGPYHAFQVSSGGTSYTVPENGTLTSWSVAATPDGAQTVALEVWREVSGTWTLEAVSPPQSMDAGTGVEGPFALSTPIAVQTDDVLGLVVTSDSGGCIRAGTDGDDVLQAGGSLVPGDTPSTFDLGQYGFYEVNVSANFAPTPSATLQVEKVVGFDSTQGFVEHVTCSAPATIKATDVALADVDLPFNSDGTPDAADAPNPDWTVVDGTWHYDFFDEQDITCTVTETDPGGANRIQYACAWTSVADYAVTADPEFGCPGPSSGPGSTGSATIVLEGNGDSGLLTVYNDFAQPPVPAPAVVVTPRFTG